MCLLNFPSSDRLGESHLIIWCNLLSWFRWYRLFIFSVIRKRHVSARQTMICVHACSSKNWLYFAYCDFEARKGEKLRWSQTLVFRESFSCSFIEEFATRLFNLVVLQCFCRFLHRSKWCYEPQQEFKVIRWCSVCYHVSFTEIQFPFLQPCCGPI